MSLLDSFGDTLQNLGNNVGNKLDDLAGKVVQQAGLKKELGGLFTQAQSNAERKEATFAPLELPEFYQKAVNVLLKNETAFANVANLAEFMQALIGTKAYAVLNVIDLDANVVPTGPREDDFTMVLVGVRIIASIIKDYTPQDVNFNRPYKFGLAGDTLTVMVRQPDGSYVPLAQNTQPIPDNTSFRNLVPGIKAHMKGLPGGYEQVQNDVPVVASTPIDPAKVAQELVNNPAGTPVAIPNQTNPNQSTLTA